MLAGAIPAFTGKRDETGEKRVKKKGRWRNGPIFLWQAFLG
jgi:hypothetical protein